MSDAGANVWRELERLLDELDEAEAAAETPDPWEGVEVGDSGLTEEQVAFLEGLHDQPTVPRLDDPPTGS